MYTMRKAISPRWLGRALAFLFALSTVLASFGIGNMTQSHSISQALNGVFHISPLLTGTVVTALALFAVLGGIRSVSRVSSILVPAMALFYLAAGLAVIWATAPPCPGHWWISSPWPSPPGRRRGRRRVRRCCLVPVCPLRRLPGLLFQ